MEELRCGDAIVSCSEGEGATKVHCSDFDEKKCK